MTKKHARLVKDRVYVTVSYVNCSHEDDFYRIEIEDSNGKTVVRADLTLENFAKMMGGRGNIESREDSFVVKFDD